MNDESFVRILAFIVLVNLPGNTMLGKKQNIGYFSFYSRF